MNTTFPAQNDVSSDENLLEDSGTTSNDLSREFTRPEAEFTFKGEPLRPYTAGTDLLFTQVLDRNDSPLFVFLSFIFIHRPKWAKERNELRKLCWDKDAYRGALFDWVESLGLLTDPEKDQAGEIFTGMREGARKSAVDVVPDGTEKKTKATRRRK